MATLATPGSGLAPSSSFTSRPRCGLLPDRSLGVSFGGELMRRAVTLRSRPWRTTAACRALKSNSDEIATTPPPFVPDQPQIRSPGVQGVEVRTLLDTTPTAIILSTNADWMLSFVKKTLPQAVIRKFTSPSTAVPGPLKSSLNANSDVVGGGGVWH